MKHVLIAALFMTTIAIATASRVSSTPPQNSDARARELIQRLKLAVLPKESGYLGIIGKSAQMATVDGRTLSVQSQNYYMLTRDLPINCLHWLAPDDTHILIKGWDRTRVRQLIGEGLPFLPFSVARRVHNSTTITFPEAPL
jgi:hypothetical protein